MLKEALSSAPTPARALASEGRLKPLTDPRALELAKREASAGTRVRRSPQVLLDLLLSALVNE